MGKKKLLIIASSIIWFILLVNVVILGIMGLTHKSFNINQIKTFIKKLIAC